MVRRSPGVRVKAGCHHFSSLRHVPFRTAVLAFRSRWIPRHPVYRFRQVTRPFYTYTLPTFLYDFSLRSATFSIPPPRESWLWRFVAEWRCTALKREKRVRGGGFDRGKVRRSILFAFNLLLPRRCVSLVFYNIYSNSISWNGHSWSVDQKAGWVRRKSCTTTKFTCLSPTRKKEREKIQGNRKRTKRDNYDKLAYIHGNNGC